MAFIDFTNGEVLTADQMDTVMRQSVMKFADAAARDTALSAVLAEGMMCYLDDTNEVLKYDGSSWIDISGDITGVTAGTALTGGGTSGNVTLDVDETALTIAQSQVTDLTTDLAGKQDDVITTQGDLVIGDASGNPVRLPVGTADQVLTSDGTTVSFQDAGGGGGLTLLSTTFISGTNGVIVSNIDQSYTNLVIEVTNFQTSSASDKIFWEFRDTTNTLWQQISGTRQNTVYQSSPDVDGDIYTDDGTSANFNRVFYAVIKNYTSTNAKATQFFGASYAFGQEYQFNYGGAVSENDPINAFRFATVAGQNFGDGTIRIFGEG